MSLLSRFRAYVAAHDLLDPGRPVVAGVSGGLDSVTLLHLLVEEGFDVVAAHGNYGLRDEAEADEAFVRTFCAEIGVLFVAKRFDLGTGNVQEAARNARYAWFGRVAEERGAAAVAVAHHRDDQAETLLLHLARGTGPVGLAGMPPRRRLGPDTDVQLVRPLLFASRADLRAYAETEGFGWREDATNAEGEYRRTAVRTQFLPALEAFIPGATEHLADTAEMMRSYLDSGAPLAAGPSLDALTEAVPSGWACAIKAVQYHPEGVRLGLWIEALRRWAPEAVRSAATARAIDALLGAQPGRRIAWPDVTVWRDREHIVFDVAGGVFQKEVAVAVGATPTPWGTFTVEHVERPEGFDPSSNVEYVDAERLGVPLVLRPWRAGDRIVPLGLKGSKKVSDLLTERRVPSPERARQLVLVSDGEIVWVVGHRVADAVRVRTETRRVVRLRWQPAKALDESHSAG